MGPASQTLQCDAQGLAKSRRRWKARSAWRENVRRDSERDAELRTFRSVYTREAKVRPTDNFTHSAFEI